MAFTTAERASIRRYLGQPALFFLQDPRLEQAMTAVPLNSADDETQVRAILGKLATIDAAIDSAANNDLEVVKVDDVELRGPGQIDALQDYGRTLIKQLSITFYFEPMADYYAGAASGGAVPLG